MIKVDKLKKIFVYNAKIFIIATAVIMIWRGIWNFLDHYVLPEYFILSNIISIIAWIIILLLIESDLEVLGPTE